MTAQIGEVLHYEGEKTWMATEPLKQYLQSRSDIKFVWPLTACWRGYFGEWQIIDNKLYLIELKAYIQGHIEVDLNYLFPRQNKVFADWFSGKIRMPRGAMLYYEHSGYDSIFEKDLFLVIENGVLVAKYEVDNAESYQKRLKKHEEEEKERTAIAALIKKEQKKGDIATIIAALTIFLLIPIGICVSIFYLIKWGTMLAYIILAVIVSGTIYVIFGGENGLFDSWQKKWMRNK